MQGMKISAPNLCNFVLKLAEDWEFASLNGKALEFLLESLDFSRSISNMHLLLICLLWLNKSAIKAAEEARQAEEACQKEIQNLHKQVEEKEAKFQHELAREKAARQRDKEKVKSKISKLWRFFKSEQAESSTAPPSNDDEDEPDPSHLDDSSDD
ncbi:hypothetical protein Cgig2_011140 [Carnegiea gigantea]|uniref:Uncharacterized protein n=1 Tax=Carnegiea gigantea TaxID=171969 RepID=A0A9Q1GKJ4_9CARY|nr:hypothetical protein Cgig2_023570 [Carnegiea gigantea]KAJ8424253.1 hypothetical protein Cgig2_011140 [Carnegiea gigantea]